MYEVFTNPASRSWHWKRGERAMYLIPWVRWRGSGWISQFVWRHQQRLEIWESWNWEFWQFGNLETWTSGTWKSENLGSKQIQQWRSSKYVSPKMLARSGLVGKFLRPFFMPYQAISHWPKKRKKETTCRNFDYLLWWARRPYSPGLGCCCFPPLAGMYVRRFSAELWSTCGGDALGCIRILEKQRMRSLKQSLTGATGGQSSWVSTHCPPQADSSKGCQWGAIVLLHHSTMIGGCIVGGSAIWNLLSSHRVIDSDRTKKSHPISISPKIVQWFTMGQSEVQSEGFWCY